MQIAAAITLFFLSASIAVIRLFHDLIEREKNHKEKKRNRKLKIANLRKCKRIKMHTDTCVRGTLKCTYPRKNMYTIYKFISHWQQKRLAKKKIASIIMIVLLVFSFCYALFVFISANSERNKSLQYSLCPKKKITE